MWKGEKFAGINLFARWFLTTRCYEILHTGHLVANKYKKSGYLCIEMHYRTLPKGKKTLFLVEVTGSLPK